MLSHVSAVNRERVKRETNRRSTAEQQQKQRKKRHRHDNWNSRARIIACLHFIEINMIMIYEWDCCTWIKRQNTRESKNLLAVARNRHATTRNILCRRSGTLRRGVRDEEGRELHKMRISNSTQHWFVQTRVLKHRGYEICPLLLVLSNQKLAMCGSVYVVWDVVAANVVLYVQSLSYYTRVDFVETRTLSKIHLIELNYSLVRYIGNRWHLLVKGSVTNTENFIIIRLQRISFSTIPLARSNSN